MNRQTDAQLLEIWKTRSADLGRKALAELRQRWNDGDLDGTADADELAERFGDD